MRVLITGCNGQVGSLLTELLKKEPSVILLALDKEHLDITKKKQVFNIVSDFQPEIIINAAAYTAVDRAEEEPELSYAINRDGPKYLAEIAKILDATIFHISTDYVFSGDKNTEYNESDIAKPQTVYGKSKLEGETAVREACDKHIILRTAWVFGEKDNNFVNTMLRLGAVRNELSIVGDQYGGPTYAGDIAESLVRIAKYINNNETVEYGIYHYSGLPHVSWYEFAEAIFEVANKYGVLSKMPVLKSITTEQYPTLAKRPRNSRLSTKKIQSTFPVKTSDWRDAIDNIQEYTG